MESTSVASQTAIIFLALHVATGSVAGIGAYLWRNPLLDGYASAHRAFHKAQQKTSMSSALADSAEISLNILRTEITAAEKTLEREIESRLAFAGKLKLAIAPLMAPRLPDGPMNGVRLGGDQTVPAAPEEPETVRTEG